MLRDASQIALFSVGHGCRHLKFGVGDARGALTQLLLRRPARPCVVLDWPGVSSDKLVLLLGHDDKAMLRVKRWL
jgi:hypothetical protein